MSEGKLQCSDAGCSEHQAGMKALQLAVCFDQLDCPQIGTLELIARRCQMVELKYKSRFMGSGGGNTADPYTDAHLYMVLAVSPELEAYVGGKLHEEAMANKERRKAAEERAALKKEKGGGDK